MVILIGSEMKKPIHKKIKSIQEGLNHYDEDLQELEKQRKEDKAYLQEQLQFIEDLRDEEWVRELKEFEFRIATAKESQFSSSYDEDSDSDYDY